MSSTATNSTTIGFIGLGIMGEGMAGRLLSQNITGTSTSKFIIWNRTKSKCEAFRKQYSSFHIEIASSPKEVLKQSSIVFSMLSTPEASRAVFFDDDKEGVLAGVSESTILVDCATLAEEDMKCMNDAVLKKGGEFMEAPVSGSKGPAATGTLIFLCAGPSTLYEHPIIQKSFNAMGKAHHYFGPEIGPGTRAKLVVNSLMGTMMAAYGESLALAESVGLNPTTMIEVFGQGAIASPIYALKGPKMIQKDHAPNFPLKHAHKDMVLASNMAKDVGAEFTVMDQAEQLFRLARNASSKQDQDQEKERKPNLEDLDFSAVFEVIHQQSKSDFSKKRSGN